MKKLILHLAVLFAFAAAGISCSSPAPEKRSKMIPEKITLSRETLMDKIKGAWAGQLIGCTYGGPVEFSYRGTMIQPYVPLEWPEGCIRSRMEDSPGLYDDIYMDLTFVDVFERLGPDAPVDSFAFAFAAAGYMLWHANQSARYNILHGILPPASGHWLNNPHSDDIDYRIEADYAGIMSPGMVNTASEISDRIGHIMNYGDGWYGGVHVGAMYALAFVSGDIKLIVSEALKTIPRESAYYKCMSDVIRWHRLYPYDWKQTWFECERKWSQDVGCPDGVYSSFNIDAVINSAYVLIGLLYGEGDFAKTIDIATRCGQDSDSNAASAGGILGAVKGYGRIPEYWLKNVREVEDMPFAGTDISLNGACRMSFGHALQAIRRNGGTVGDGEVVIACQQPATVRFEQGFEGHSPAGRIPIHKPLAAIDSIVFEGIGIVFGGSVRGGRDGYEAQVEMHIDGKPVETALLPVSRITRRNELFWKYRLPPGRHTVTFKWLNPEKNVSIDFGEALIYS
ncbi:MAG: ADP-ribosylglycohydrolase family protein [Tannerella sp.]|nr:ADP-ribosylglycohydrolase family protein [Tannerella sp.]